MKKLSQALAAAGVLLIAYAVVGRFVDNPTVLGCIIKQGMAASTVLIGGNTLLLLALLVDAYSRKQP
jgi:predicted acyltransferase